MATYKKRGYKPKTKAEQEEVIQDDSTTAEVFSTLDEGANRTEEWVAKNQKGILITIGAIVLIVMGYLGYQKFIQEPRELEASNELTLARDYFSEALNATADQDSLYALALNGAEGKYGFIDIIENYGGTKAAELAHYYAGMSYLNSNQYQEAIEYLEDFESDDVMLEPLALGAMGDAFVQLNQPEDALEYYERAAKANSNEFTTPKFLLKAGITAIGLGKNDAAISYLQQIKKEYPNAPQVQQATLFLGRAGADID
ncbi:tetratricopeptide repeat protein [Croceiramulus getboli]|nr:tetratricopeptide repeat protein [Flavobacteriaceae bacterium YJPT1-3]